MKRGVGQEKIPVERERRRAEKATRKAARAAARADRAAADEAEARPLRPAPAALGGAARRRQRVHGAVPRRAR